MSNQELVQIAIRRHWLTDASESKRRRDLFNHRTLRATRAANGLNWLGKPRVNRSWPELKGLIDGAYHAAYMRIWRRERKAR